MLLFYFYLESISKMHNSVQPIEWVVILGGCHASCATGEVVLSASERAFSLINMTEHEGIHPCMGAVDLIPFYPLGEDVSLEDCGKEAQGKVYLFLVVPIGQDNICKFMSSSLLSCRQCSD